VEPAMGSTIQVASEMTRTRLKQCSQIEPHGSML
jgi:hypothetical protein